MNILYLAHRVPYPPNKGDKIRALWEIKSLSASHNVDLFCFFDHDEDRHSIDALRPYCRECYVERLSWWRSRAQALSAVIRKRPFSLAYFYSKSMEARVKAALATRRYDVILCFGSAMAGYVDGECSVPAVLDMVDVDSAKWAEYAHDSIPALRWLWRQEARLLGEYERKATETFARTLLCTDAEADLLRRSSPNGKIDVLRHMVDTAYFDPGKVEVPAHIAALQPYVLFAGSMDYAPNIDAVEWFYRNSLPLMRREMPELRFVIVGRNPSRAVRELAHDAGAVTVTGTVPDVRSYFRAAAATVAPMLLARGVQNKILESLAMGVPVAASSRAAVAFPREVVSSIVVEDDASALAGKLLEVIHKGPKPPVPALRQSLEKVFGDQSLKTRLERILLEAAATSRSQESAKAGAPVTAASRLTTQKTEGAIHA
ncbi:MAG TPA: TIGR03087 family PEP-CTERM/XrtA system glycosyltransferase [Candidatus Angelobacter sp.]|nr:TIGR03087 family PEP-CTERM/XrtA system glycosyltransferase [Candidatus Angelobacter sp.]